MFITVYSYGILIHVCYDVMNCLWNLKVISDFDFDIEVSDVELELSTDNYNIIYSMLHA
jgi:hypothetical protein